MAICAGYFADDHAGDQLVLSEWIARPLREVNPNHPLLIDSQSYGPVRDSVSPTLLRCSLSCTNYHVQPASTRAPRRPEMPAPALSYSISATLAPTMTRNFTRHRWTSLVSCLIVRLDAQPSSPAIAQSRAPNTAWECWMASWRTRMS